MAKKVYIGLHDPPSVRGWKVHATWDKCLKEASSSQLSAPFNMKPFTNVVLFPRMCTAKRMKDMYSVGHVSTIGRF